MFFMLFNLILGAIMIGLSFSIDRRNNLNKTANQLVNLILTLASLFILMAATIALSLWGPGQLSLAFGKLTFMFMAWFCTACCVYMLAFPNYKLPAFVTVIQWLLNVFAFILVFIYSRGIKSIVILDNAFQISSGSMFTGKLRDLFPVSSFGFFIGLYCVFLPLFTSLMVLVRAENMPHKLDRQRGVLNTVAVLTSWAVGAYIFFCARFQPMFPALMMVAFVPEMLLFSLASANDEIWDAGTISRSIFQFILRYMIPALFAGAIYFFILPLEKVSYALLVFVLLLVSIGMTSAGVFVTRAFKKREVLRDKRYADSFERDMSSIDFNSDSQVITQSVFDSFKKYVGTSSLHILVNSGSTLETVYSSDSKNISLPVDSQVFESVLAAQHPIVFREWAIRDNAVSLVRLQLLEMLNSAESDGFILLNEGRQIVGIIFLGKKTNGNSYSEYDYNVFTRLYSNFFVVGYYMKNIMNESVVGTVNREIRMSGQIITSIQENMDVIKHPKIDTGYLMVPAHNIGGEFVDMIRLSDTRYIYIIGAMSGKGIAASMNMVILKSIIRTFLAETGDFKKLVIKVNSFIRESLPKGTFFAGTFGLLDFATNTMYYINCGSPALFMYTRAYNNVIEIQGEGHILGFVRDITNYIKVKKVSLAEGDIIFTCTDGLIESRSLRGDEFGKSRVQNVLTDNSNYPATKMAQFAYNTLVEFTSKELEDDVTVLVLKYLGGK